MNAYHNDEVPPGELPLDFCWTRFGIEAGEPVARIFRRKEQERKRNGGVFLWGIGNSIRPSLVDLVSSVNDPRIVFSPMRSVAARKDSYPGDLVMWCSAVGVDGRRFRLPAHSLVTSRSVEGRPFHFALVCQRDTELPGEDRRSLSISELRNRRSGSIVGASQVTSVVRRISGSQASDYRYPVATEARLVYPYLLKLTGSMPVPTELRLDRLDGRDETRAVEELLRLRSSVTSLSDAHQLALI